MEHPQLNGLYLVNEFITPEFELELVEELDSQPWNDSMQRRTQHYGFEYGYQRAAVGFRKEAAKAAPAPPPLTQAVVDHFTTLDCIPSDYNFNQVIVNEYTQKVGIGAHVDNVSFGPVVCSLSLLGGCNMILTHKDDHTKSFTIWLEPRSLLVLQRDARYEYKHEIPARITMYDANGNAVKRSPDWRRISITARSL